MTQTTTKGEVLRLVDLLELQIKICDCSAGSKYDMLDKIDNIHSVIHNTECESANTKDEDIKVNVKYELDKEAYRQYVADIKEIEAEFKGNNSMVVGVFAGGELENGDMVYKKSDGKMYKSELESNNETKTVNTCYEGSMQEFIEKLGYTIRASSDGKSLRFDRIDYDEQHETIPATLKGVCEWWISKYKRNSTFDEYTIMSNITENMEYLMKRSG